MKKYINAKAEIFKLDAGNIMFISINQLNMDEEDFETPEGYVAPTDNGWGNYNG